MKHTIHIAIIQKMGYTICIMTKQNKGVEINGFNYN